MREPKKTANHIDNILSLEDFLPYQLSILSNRVSSTIATAYQDKFALTVTEWRIMAVLGETMGVGSPDVAGVSADTVSQRTQVEKSLISRAIKRLLARNLVRRETDAQDARKHCLRLSRTGQDIYRQVVPLSKAYEQELFACLSNSERNTLHRLIKKVSGSIESKELED